jgi:xylulokinase
MEKFSYNFGRRHVIMSESYLLGVDIGTYSSKGVLVTLEGEVVASHVVPHEMSMPKPGHFEHDADNIWWHDFVKIAQSILRESEIDPKQILSIGVSAIGSCVLPIDEQGKPLRPGILYGIDTRAVDEIDYLEKVIAKKDLPEFEGLKLTSQTSGPKILWIRNHEPEVYRKTRWFLTSQAYVVFRLTGVPSIDIYTAGGYAPMFDSKNIRWMSEMEDEITEVERLPDFYWSHEVVGSVTNEAEEQTGLVAGTPVIAGTTDAASEAVSVGLANVGDMMIMFGSTIFFIQKTDKLLRPEKFWASNFLSEGTYAFLGGMSAAGSLTRWFLNEFGWPEKKAEAEGGQNAYSALANLAANSVPGAHGLVALPYFEGERTPIHDPNAKGVLFGLNLKHTRADFYRAILESVAYGIKHNIDEMKNEGVEARRILSVGGGTKNLVWMQIVADVAGISLNIPEQNIGASYGDAFMAGLGVGVFDDYKDISQWVRIKHNIKPQSEYKQIYNETYSLYRELYQSTKSLMNRLSKLTK